MRRTAGEGRLDNFVDGAFAFSVTLLVIGGGQVPDSVDALFTAAGSVPAFAIAFSMLAMFWHAHVRWRALDGHGGSLAVLLSLLLVFLVLVYVYPLRLMASALVDYAAGRPSLVRARDLGRLFVFYSAGFACMSACMAGLYALTARAAPGDARKVATGETVIWLLLVATGLASALLARAEHWLAPWIYALLPVAIGGFAWRHDWGGVSAAPPPATDDR